MPTRPIIMFQASAVSVLIAANAETASRVDDLTSQAGLALKLKVVVDSSGASDGWVDFSSLIKLNGGGSDEALSNKPAAQLADTDGAVIFFTSGTTSLPKGCQHTHGSLATVFDSRRPLWEAGPESRAANFLPNNHIMGFIFTVPFLLRGGSVVYPAGVFTPAAMLNALVKEGCNETVLVPIMVYALINIMSEQKIPRLEHLRCVGMGGVCQREELGRRFHPIRLQADMSRLWDVRRPPNETSAIQDRDRRSNHGSPCCCKVASGCTVKICSPGTTTAVPINTPGELHMSGPSIITSYLGGRNKEGFYVEDGKQWFKSGDQRSWTSRTELPSSDDTRI